MSKNFPIIPLKKQRSFKKSAIEDTKNKLFTDEWIPFLLTIINIITSVLANDYLLETIFLTLSTYLLPVCIYYSFYYLQLKRDKENSYYQNRKMTVRKIDYINKDSSFIGIKLIVAFLAVIIFTILQYYRGITYSSINTLDIMSTFFTIAFVDLIWVGGIKNSVSNFKKISNDILDDISIKTISLYLFSVFWAIVYIYSQYSNIKNFLITLKLITN